MRDLLFKNLTSTDKRRKIIASSEIAESRGVRSTIRRHLVCMVREVKDDSVDKPVSTIHVLREKNSREQREKFYFRIKGSVFAVSGGKTYLIVFSHSLRICLSAVAQGSMIE